MSELRVTLTVEPFAIELVEDTGDERYKEVACSITIQGVAEKLDIEGSYRYYTIVTDPNRGYEYDDSKRELLLLITQAREKGYTLQDVANAIRDIWLSRYNAHYSPESAQSIAEIDSDGGVLRLPSLPDMLGSPIRLQIGSHVYNLARGNEETTLEEVTHAHLESRVADLQDIANTAIADVRTQSQREMESLRSNQHLIMPNISTIQAIQIGIIMSLAPRDTYSYTMPVTIWTKNVQDGNLIWKLKKPRKQEAHLHIVTRREGEFLEGMLLTSRLHPVKHPHCYDDGRICYGSRSEFPILSPSDPNLCQKLTILRDETCLILETIVTGSLARSSINDVSSIYHDILQAFYDDDIDRDDIADLQDDSQDQGQQNRREETWW